MLSKISKIRQGLRGWNRFSDSCGQDLIEYTLLLTFVCLAAVALLIGAGNALGGVWSVTNSHLTKGHHYAKGQDK